MRNTSAAHHWTLLVALLASPSCASAQVADVQNPDVSPPSPTITTASQAAAQKQAQKVPSDSQFRSLHNLVISPDGAWVAAEERWDRGDVNIRVWSTKRDVSYTIERGQNPRISRDARWVSALLKKPPFEESQTARPTNQRAGQTLVLLDLQDGTRKTFDFVLSYDMTHASTYLLYLQSPDTNADEKVPSKDEATKPATKPTRKERMMGTLHQVPLDPVRFAREHPRFHQPEQMFTHENVVAFAAHPTSHHFAYVWHDEETGRDTLHICKWGIRAWYTGDKIEGLCWARDPRDGATDDVPTDYITLGFLVSTETTGKDGMRRVNSALYTWQPDRMSSPPNPMEKFTRVDAPQ